MQIGRLVAESIECVECGKIFIVGEREINWYSQHMGWVLPKRCPECRKARRKQREAKA